MRDRVRQRGARRATAVGVTGNSILFAVKGIVGVASGSIALISDAMNSLVDVVASVAIWYSVDVAGREPDADHPFGHHRAETIAALGVAIFTAILGFEIGRAAVDRLIEGAEPIDHVGWALGALGFSMAGNLALARYLRRRGEALESPAILANAVECENDIGTSLAALAGVGAAALGWPAIDPVAGIVVGAWIVWGGVRFGRQNIDYLMGKSPGDDLLERIRGAALGVPGVRGVHDVRAHYVGHRIHVELHAEVDQELRVRRSHDLGGEAGRAIEALPGVDRAFVHLDPVLDSTFVLETLAERERTASRIYAGLGERHAGRPALASLWGALATAAQARADRLEAVRRLRGAGWHFAESDLAPEEIDALGARAEAIAADVEEGDPGAAGALELAAELEDPAARRAYRTAVTPRDPTLAPSIEGAAPPPPPAALLERRLDAARAEVESERERAALGALARALEGGAPAGEAR